MSTKSAVHIIENFDSRTERQVDRGPLQQFGLGPTSFGLRYF